MFAAMAGSLECAGASGGIEHLKMMKSQKRTLERAAESSFRRFKLAACKVFHSP